MILPTVHLTVENQLLTVCRLGANDPVPLWASGPHAFLSLTRTADELSIVCAAALVPAGVRQEPGWRALKVAGPLDFGLTGVLASLLDPLARAGISIFAISTHDTDYVLVKADRIADAVQVLQTAGNTVSLS